MPFPVDELTHGITLVEAYSSDAVLKQHCLVSESETFGTFSHLGVVEAMLMFDDVHETFVILWMKMRIGQRTAGKLAGQE